MSLTDIDKRIMQSLFNSGQMTMDEIAGHFNTKVNLVKYILTQDIKPSCIDRVEATLTRGEVIYIDLPCYGTLSYDDVSAIQDAIFNHYFPGESQDIG